MNADRALNATRRVAYAFVGLLGGNSALLLFLLQNAMRLRSSLFGMHMGEPARQIPIALQLFVLYARLSFVGWLFVGFPIALLLPARSITGLWWPLRVLVGAALGPLALLVIFVLLGHGHVSSTKLHEHESAVGLLNFGFHCFFCALHSPAAQTKGF